MADDSGNIVTGVAGASAHREYEKRSKNDAARIRARYPLLGGLILRLAEERQTTRSYETGAIGERIVGRHLDAVASRGVIALHDRRIPRSSANIDHIPSSSHSYRARHQGAETGRSCQRGTARARRGP